MTERRTLPCLTDRDAWTSENVWERQQAREACGHCYRIEACYAEAMAIAPGSRVGVWGGWDFSTFPNGRKELPTTPVDNRPSRHPNSLIGMASPEADPPVDKGAE